MSDTPKILIVDDEESVRRSFSRVLSGVRCTARSVTSGDEALVEMNRNDYDVVLLDLRMPGMDGLSLLRAIRQRWPDSQVVVITGFPALDSAKEAVRLGACDYLAKPVDADQVIHATRDAVLRKRWALRPAAGVGEPSAGPIQESHAGACRTAC